MTDSRDQAEARCRVAVAAVRRDPSDDSEQVTQALRGEPLVLGEARDGWVAVTTGYAYPGWMRLADVEPGRGSFVADLGGTPLEAGRTYLDSPYLWGGMSELGIDCSGLVHMAYRRVGRLVPRDADQQQAAGEPVGELDAGVLVTYGEGVADHIAFRVGDGRILHATGRDELGVVEEQEPETLRARRLATFLL